MTFERAQPLMEHDTESSQFFAELEAHKRILFKVARSYCYTTADREDLMQDIVVALWRAFPAFERRSRFSTWMYQIALNVAISYRRSETLRTRHVVSDEAEILRTAVPLEAESTQVTLLYNFIEELNPFDKAVVLLYLDGHSYQETSRVWLVANAAVGLCCIPIVLWFARMVSRGKMARPSHWFLREVAGERINAAKGFLHQLSDLEQERSRAD